MILEEIIRNNPAVLGLLTFLLGGLLGNRYAICRDQRKEFNEIADVVALLLINKRKAATHLRISSGPNNDQLETLKRRSGLLKRPSITKACELYTAAVTDSKNKESDSVGQPFYKNKDPILTAIDDLLEKVKRR